MSKVIIITGGGSGVGNALAIGLSRSGHTVVASVRSDEEISSLSERLTGKFLVQKCDITLEEDCKRLVNAGIRAFGQTDVLINNAGVYIGSSLLETPLEKINQVIDVVYKGSLQMTKLVFEHMAEQKSGQIISIQDVRFKNGTGPYNPKSPGTVDLSAKFAKAEFTELIRREAEQYCITVTAVYLKSVASQIDIDDPSTPTKGADHPKDVVDKVDQAIKNLEAEVFVTPEV